MSGEAVGRCNYISLHEASGYAEAGRRCVLALAGAGAQVTWTPVVPGTGWGLYYEPLEATSVGDASLDPLLVRSPRFDTAVAHLTPEYFPIVRTQHPDQFLIGHTVWETDRLPAHWPPLLEVADLLVVPCGWNAETIRAAGVGTPTAVVPHVVPAVTPCSSPTWSRVPPGAFVFYTIAPWTARKAPWNTVRAYLEAFTGSDPVLLVVKTSSRDFTHLSPAPVSPTAAGTAASALARLVGEFQDPADVLLVTGELTGVEMAALHTRGDCYVSLSRSEGWGLGAFDAGSYGNPVVTTGYGGHLDYLDDDTALLVDFELVPVHDPAGLPSYTPDQRWAEPSVADGARLLRTVFDDRDGALRRGHALADRVHSRYRPDLVAAEFLAAVDRARRAVTRPSPACR